MNTYGGPAVIAGPPSAADERQVLELIDYLDRRGILSYLVTAARRERPGMF
jgi:hypothetical protein